ncbi:hypothetical protein BJX64DRAFT_273060 [Aspergillus heterothallicus]
MRCYFFSSRLDLLSSQPLDLVRRSVTDGTRCPASKSDRHRPAQSEASLLRKLRLSDSSPWFYHGKVFDTTIVGSSKRYSLILLSFGPTLAYHHPTLFQAPG